MRVMELAVAVTLYFSFCGFLVFPLFNAPQIFPRMSITLCGFEFALAVVWAASRTSCSGSDCPPAEVALQSMAGLEVPVLTGVMFVIALAYAVSVARSW
jgi:hypothetical protein